MLDYLDQIGARVVAFDRHLRLMVERRGRERTHDCAIIFSEGPPDDESADRVTATAAPVPDLVIAERAEATGEGGFAGDQAIVRGPDRGDSPPEPGRAGGGSGGSSGGDERYVQFAFMKRTFYLDLPDGTLFPAEAARLLRQRSGFFWLQQRRWRFQTYEHWQEDVRSCNPVQKEYLNADTRSAAEDVVWIIHRLWRFPLDWPWYFQALRFNTSRSREWEKSGPVDAPLPGNRSEPPC